MEKIKNKNHKVIPVWLVKQTQPFAGYEDTTIGVFSNEDAAIQSMNNLNAEYGSEDEEHYYTTELML